MDPKWYRREEIDRELGDKGTEELVFDPDSYRWHYEGVPFNGVSVGRYPDGQLQCVVYFVDGSADGVSVAWYPNGQIEMYRDMAEDSTHGLRRGWAQDGTLLLSEIYKYGEFVRDA